MDITERLIEALGAQSPGWYLDLADKNELEDFARAIITDPRSDKLALVGRLQRLVANRLFIVLRAAVQSGLVEDRS